MPQCLGLRSLWHLPNVHKVGVTPAGAVDEANVLALQARQRFQHTIDFGQQRQLMGGRRDVSFQQMLAS